MFCIFLNIPYEYQIKKIYPGFLSSFLDRVELLATENSSSYILKKDSYLYFFDDASIATVFFVARFLHVLSSYIEQVSSKIHEYSIIVDFFSDEEGYDVIVDKMLSYQRKNLECNNILISAKASKYIKKYMLLSDSSFPSFNKVDNFSFFTQKNALHNMCFIKDAGIFIRSGQNYLMALYNFFLMYPLKDSDINRFEDADKKTYLETRSSLSFFSKNRFNQNMPKYFIDAFIIYAKLHINMYKSVNKISDLNIYVDALDKGCQSELNKIVKIVGDVKVISLRDESYNIDDLPDDFLSLVYILLFANRFVFFTEFSNLFFDLTKSNAYDEVLDIMYRDRIILEKSAIYSYNESAFKDIERKIRVKKSKLNFYIGRFLWDKYEMAEIIADMGFKAVLDMLRYNYVDSFLIDVFFILDKSYPLKPEEVDSNTFKHIEVLKKYDAVLKLKESGSYIDAITIAKELSTYFHKNHILSGEYKSLSLLAFLYLKNNNINDSLTYYVYALELAKKIKNDVFMCESLYFLSVVYFLQKDFKNAFAMLQELSTTISTSFRQEWKVVCLFMQGRIYVELGEESRAVSFFKLGKDFAHIYFPHLKSMCNLWYGRALLYDGKLDVGYAMLHEDRCKKGSVFLMEACILFSKARENKLFLFSKIKEEYDESKRTGKTHNEEKFLFVEDVMWYKIYKKKSIDRLFASFYNYYMIVFSKEKDKNILLKYLKELSELAIESLYAKDNNASLLLYLCYEAQCKIDNKITGAALGFLSKACRVMQRASSFMYETSMRDKFMKKNLWNAKLFKCALENKLI